MKLRYIFLLIVLIAITGCTRPAKVRSLSNTSGRLPASQSMNEEEESVSVRHHAWRRICFSDWLWLKDGLL